MSDLQLPALVSRLYGRVDLNSPSSNRIGLPATSCHGFLSIRSVIKSTRKTRALEGGIKHSHDHPGKEEDRLPVYH